MPAGTLRLPWLSFFRAFSSVVRQIPGYNSQTRDTARTLPNIFALFYVLFVLCRSVYCLCVNVYCTTATGCQPNCSLTSLSYHSQAVPPKRLDASVKLLGFRPHETSRRHRCSLTLKSHHLYLPFALNSSPVLCYIAVWNWGLGS